MKKGMRDTRRIGFLAFTSVCVVLGLLFAAPLTSELLQTSRREVIVEPRDSEEGKSSDEPQPSKSTRKAKSKTGVVTKGVTPNEYLDESQGPAEQPSADNEKHYANSVEEGQADNGWPEEDSWEDVETVCVDGAEDSYQSESWMPLELPEGVEYEPQVVLLQVDSRSDADEVNAILSSVEGVCVPYVTQEQVSEGLIRVVLDQSASMEEVMGELASSDVARSVQPNYIYRAADLLDSDASEDEDQPAPDDEAVVSESIQVDEVANADDAVVIGEDIEEESACEGDESSDMQAEPSAQIEVLEEGSSQGDDQGDSAIVVTSSGEHVVDVSAESQVAREEIDDARSAEQWALGSIQAREAWVLAKANREVTVAVIDMGFDATHEDLAKNVVAPYNSYYRSTDKNDLVTSVVSNNRHGTHVAGIISAVANNGYGIAGISYNARVMPICAADRSGMVTSASLYHAFERAVSMGKKYNVRVINASLGSKQVSLETTLGDIIQKANDANIVVVNSAGNLDESAGLYKAYAHYPSDIEGVVGVIDLEQCGTGVRKSSTSNYNRHRYDNKNISAPGTDIISTVPGSYAYLSGTSMAAPHVAGVLALQFAANPALTAEKATQILYATATDLGTKGWDTTYGWGEASAYHAVVGSIQGIDAAQVAMVQDQAAGRAVAMEEAAASCVAYRAHVQGADWQAWKRKGAVAGSTNKAKTLDAIQIKLQSPPFEGGVEYRAYVQGSGWQAWKSNGKTSGTTGKAKPIEAIRIQLTGRMAKKYDIWYRVKTQTYGTMGWAKNGARAGTVTFSKGVLSYEVCILPKGSAAPGSTKRAYVTRLVQYRTYLQSYGKQSWAYDGKTSGKTGKGKKLEALSVRLSDPWYGGKIQYRAYVQSVGWQPWKSNGTIAGIRGQGLRLEAIRIRLTGEMAKKYDVWYRVYAQKYGWLGWARNGAKAGTKGLSKRLEGLQIKLVKKGANPPGSTAHPFRQ